MMVVGCWLWVVGCGLDTCVGMCVACEGSGQGCLAACRIACLYGTLACGKHR